jgi:hypothetical protein
MIGLARAAGIGLGSLACLVALAAACSAPPSAADASPTPSPTTGEASTASPVARPNPSPKDAELGPAPPGCSDAHGHIELTPERPDQLVVEPICVWYLTVITLGPPPAGVAVVRIDGAPILTADLARLMDVAFPGAGSGEFDFEIEPRIALPGNRLQLDLSACSGACAEVYVVVPTNTPAGG